MPHPTAALNILVFGASYGALLASKALFGGHAVTLICQPDTAALIARDGLRVRYPIKGRSDPIEVHSIAQPGSVRGAGPTDVRAADFDLVVLAMQEPQYGAAGVRNLLADVARARVPCVSLMNMPPPPFLARLPGLDVAALVQAYTEPAVWAGFEPGLVSLASPDPQAVRTAGLPANVITVTLPTNFKAATFADASATARLRRLEADIDAARWPTPDGAIELPVKLRVSDSLYVPLAKWAMLLAGNYRCLTDTDMRPTRDAVHADLAAAQSIYDFTNGVVRALGASDADLVPFDKYAAAAQGLSRPASVARAVTTGATRVERADKLVQLIARAQGRSNRELDTIVARLDARLAANAQTTASPR